MADHLQLCKPSPLVRVYWSFSECQHLPEGPSRGVQPPAMQYGNCRLLHGMPPRNVQVFSSTLEDNTVGCQNSPCLVDTGLVVADTTTLMSMQQWLSWAPLSSGYVDTERCILLQILVPASHKSLTESCTYSSRFPFWSALILPLHCGAVQGDNMAPPVFSSLVMKVEGNCLPHRRWFLSSGCFCSGMDMNMDT